MFSIRLFNVSLEGQLRVEKIRHDTMFQDRDGGHCRNVLRNIGRMSMKVLQREIAKMGMAEARCINMADLSPGEEKLLFKLTNQPYVT